MSEIVDDFGAEKYIKATKRVTLSAYARTYARVDRHNLARSDGSKRQKGSNEGEEIRIKSVGLRFGRSKPDQRKTVENQNLAVFGF